MLTSDLQPTPRGCSKAAAGAVMGLRRRQNSVALGGGGTRRKHCFVAVVQPTAAGTQPKAAGCSRSPPFDPALPAPICITATRDANSPSIPERRRSNAI
jgi:hypothetical protein